MKMNALCIAGEEYAKIWWNNRALGEKLFGMVLGMGIAFPKSI